MSEAGSLIGQRLGVYHIQSLLGAGGMGQVYRARDTRLLRDVAIKILPDSFAGDLDRRARFDREARLLASLNHPNIAAIHGVEDLPGGAPALIIELVDGETLAERIAKGPLRAQDAIDIARQVAGALDAAHEKGIVHRDLKPANIALSRDQVKVLDFGIAKALDLDADNATTVAGNTVPGTIIGTAAYMSPEQARGLPVDKRTDIWAFGCVLFEMLTGRSPFAEPTTSDTVAAILEREPQWQALPAAVPRHVRRILERCLEKDPRRRLRDIGDAEHDLAGDADDAPIPPPRRSRFAYMSIAIAAGVAVAAWLFGVGRRPAPAVPVAESRFTISELQLVSPHVAFSPDGTSLVIASRFDRPQQLALRRLGSLDLRRLPGTDGATFPFWSPDGRSVAFFADRKLKRIDLDSDAVQDITDASIGRGGVWSADGSILFAPTAASAIYRVAATGGKAVQVTTLAGGQNDHRAPVLLPGSHHFLYYARGQATVRGVWVARIDGSEPRRLLDAEAAAVYAPSGRLLFARQGQLLSQRFDPDSLTLSGGPVPVADNISINRGVSLATLAVSSLGTIAYATASSVRTQFVWFDRTGTEVGTLGSAEQVPFTNPSLSPDGRSLAFARLLDGNWDIWLMDVARGVATLLTPERNLDFAPVWTPDGASLIYQSYRKAGADIYRRAPGSNNPELLLQTDAEKVPMDVSRDGRYLLFGTESATTNTDIWLLPLQPPGPPRALVDTRFAEGGAQFSNDMRWIAYSSNETGQFEVYVRPFERPGAPQRISTSGGTVPRWGHRGHDMFFVAADGKLMRVPVPSSDRWTDAAPEPLFTMPVDPAGFGPRSPYVVSLDDQQFLMPVAIDQPTPSSLVILSNWHPPSTP